MGWIKFISPRNKVSKYHSTGKNMASDFWHTDSSVLNLWLGAVPQISKPTVKHRDNCLWLLPGRDLGVQRDASPFSTTIQPRTALMGYRSCCRYFTGCFWNISRFFFFCLSSSNWYLFGPLKQRLVNRQLQNSKKVERAICEWLRFQETDLNVSRIFQFVQSRDRHIKVLRS